MHARAVVCCVYCGRRYGQQLVPIPDAATADLMRYSPGKCMDLIGFTSRDNIPRW